MPHEVAQLLHDLLGVGFCCRIAGPDLVDQVVDLPSQDADLHGQRLKDLLSPFDIFVLGDGLHGLIPFDGPPTKQA